METGCKGGRDTHTHGEMGIDIGRGGDEGERGFTADGHKRAREK